MPVNLSNEFALDLTVNDVIFEAYDLLQVASDGASIPGDLYNRAVASLNIMLKLWETQGIHLWTFTEGSLFLKVGQAAYDFRLEGSDTSAVHLANAFEQRSLAAAVAVNDLQITLDDVSNLQSGDQVGYINTDNDLEWFLVMEIVGAVVTVDHPAVTAALINSVVYTYDYHDADVLTADTVADSIVEVTDTTLFNIGDVIALLLDTNVTETRTISAIDQGLNELTVSLAFTGTATAGNPVLNLTTRRNLFRPVKRVSEDQVRRRESTDYEIPIVFESRKDYFDLPNKNQNGTPIQAYFDRQQQQGVMYVWNPPGNATSIINFTYERAIMVVNDPDQTFDLPGEWLEALVYNLAKRLIPKVGCSTERKNDIKEGAVEYLDNALAFDQAVYSIRLMPQQYG